MVPVTSVGESAQWLRSEGFSRTCTGHAESDETTRVRIGLCAVVLD